MVNLISSPTPTTLIYSLIYIVVRLAVGAPIDPRRMASLNNNINRNRTAECVLEEYHLNNPRRRPPLALSLAANL